MPCLEFDVENFFGEQLNLDYREVRSISEQSQNKNATGKILGVQREGD